MRNTDWDSGCCGPVIGEIRHGKKIPYGMVSQEEYDVDKQKVNKAIDDINVRIDGLSPEGGDVTKEYVDTHLALKANQTDLVALEEKVDNLPEPDVTKQYVDTHLALKANQTDLVALEEKVDNLPEPDVTKQYVDTNLALKANQTNLDEANDRIDDLDERVKGLTPGGGGDVTKEYVDTHLALKANQTDLVALEEKVDNIPEADVTKEYVDNKLILKANQTDLAALEEKVDNIPGADVTKEYVDTHLSLKANQTDLDDANVKIEDLDERVKALTPGGGGDVTKEYVDTELAKKADLSKVDELEQKIDDIPTADVDKAYVDTHISEAERTAKQAADALSEKINAVDAKSATKSSVESLSSRMSIVENDIAIQTERIDQIAKLPEGSTTADAEIFDIRIGADGTKYNTAGNAVREQINGLKNIICDDIEFELEDHKRNPLVDSEGNIIIGKGTFIKTDKELQSEYMPANAKTVGDEISDIRNRIAFPYNTFLSNRNYYENEWGIPILELTGTMEGMTKKISNDFTYRYASADARFSGNCSMKWQGSSSSVYPKKNFTVTFDKEVQPVWAWGAHKKYCLKANFIDPTHSRNIVSAKLWAEMVKKREVTSYQPIMDNDGNAITDDKGNNIEYNANRLMLSPNYGAVDGIPIILALNGEFYGLYTFNIPKDAWMFDMDKGALTSAIITAESNATSSSNFKALAVVDGTDYDIEYRTGDISDDDVIESFNTLIQKCIDCDSQTKYDDLKQYVDTASVIDYIIHALLTTNTDWKKNLIWVTYDNKKYKMCAYDMDTTYGLLWTGTGYTTQAAMTVAKLKAHRLIELVCKYEKDTIKSKYNSTKGWIFSEEHFQDIFNNFASKIPAAVAMQDWIKWPTIPSTSSNNLNQIFNQFRIRIPYVDGEISRI